MRASTIGAARFVARAIPQRPRAGLRRYLRTAKHGARRLALTGASRSSLLAGLYFGLFNRELAREAMAVAAGQLRYDEDLRSDSPGYYLLRRNIHRLEKGLIMCPRRAVFALDYLDETVNVFTRAVAAAKGEWNRELIWATDVLTEYFAVVDTTVPQIASAFRQFRQVTTRPVEPEVGARAIPYRRDLDAPPPVSFDAFMALCRRRRSVRWFADRPVPQELVDHALLAAAQAPSACNRQPFVFRTFLDCEAARRVGAIPMGTRGFSDQFTAIAVVVGQLRAYPFERDRHAIYIDASLAAMSFMLALETMGLASCSINWPDQEPHETRMQEELCLDRDERVIMLIAFGWPDPMGMVPFSAKRELDQLRWFE